LADDPPGRNEVLSENPVAARAGEFLTWAWFWHNKRLSAA
jgi:hypothetical protein